MSNKVFELGFSQTRTEGVIDSLRVEGSIPAWLSGTLVRNGQGTFHAGGQAYRHWFDGPQRRQPIQPPAVFISLRSIRSLRSARPAR